MLDKPARLIQPNGAQELLFRVPLNGKTPKKIGLDLRNGDSLRAAVSNPAFNKRYEYYHFSDEMNTPNAVKPPLPTKTVIKPVTKLEAPLQTFS